MPFHRLLLYMIKVCFHDRNPLLFHFDWRCCYRLFGDDYVVNFMRLLFKSNCYSFFNSSKSDKRCQDLGGVCSIQLSYWDIYKFYAIFKARRNRTICRLGGPRYIHLTKETNAVFSGFSALLATAAISMNSITLVMNFHCILFWHSGQSLLESNSDLSLSNFHKSQPWLNLRSSSPHRKHISFSVNLSQGKSWFF